VPEESADTRSPDCVLIADDHEVTRFGLGQFMRSSLGAKAVLEADRFEVALALLAKNGVALAIIDLGMPGLSGPQALAEVRRQYPDTKLVVLTGSVERDDILACMAAGVHGYIVKTEGLDKLADRLKRVLGGEIYVPPLLAELPPAEMSGPLPGAGRLPEDLVRRLTPRQQKVMRYLEQGLTNKQIGRELEISDRTVKMHLAAIYPALGVHNRTQAVAVMRDLRTRRLMAETQHPAAAEESMAGESRREE
jgi:DNA-binding NarL/FixJ family response regulator